VTRCEGATLTTNLQFPDRLAQAVAVKNSRVCVGLDPRPDLLPSDIKTGSDIGQAAVDFCCQIIDAVADYAVCVKPQAAYFEVLAPDGLAAMWQVIAFAKSRGLLVILDAKRSDISSTAQAYAQACFGKHYQQAVASPDAVTVNPYLGSDGVQPFLDVADTVGGGVFVLVKTSNESSDELQDLKTQQGTVYETVANLVNDWGTSRIAQCGYSSVGAVVGATYPEQLKVLRRQMAQSIFLIPGYGVQGGGPEDVAVAFDKDGLGAIVNSSRGIIYAYRESGGDYQQAAAQAARTMRDDINAALK